MVAPGRTDPFPRTPFVSLVGRLPSYARLAWRLARDPAISRPRRAAVLAAAAYLASPVDLVPGIIPVVGQLDDVALGLVAIRAALRGLPADARQAHLAAVGLRSGDIDVDLATTGRTAAWLARRGARLSLRLARMAFEAGLRTSRGAVRALIGLGRRARGIHRG